MGSGDREEDNATSARLHWDDQTERPTLLDPWLTYLLAVLAYLAMALLARAWTTAPDGPLGFRPAAGVPIAAAFLVRRHARLPVAIAAAVTGAALSTVLLYEATARTVVVATLVAGTETAAALVLYAIVVPRTKIRVPGITLTIASTAAAALLGALVGLVGYLPPERLEFLATSTMGDWLGIMAVQTLPHLHRVQWVGDEHGPRLFALDLGLTAALTVGITVAVFASSGPYPFVLFPGMAWLSMRFGPRAAMPLVIGLIAVASTMHSRGHGPFAAHDHHEVMLALFNVALLLTAHLLSVNAELADRERRRLRALLVALPDHVTLSDSTGRVLFGFITLGRRNRRLRDLTELLSPEDKERAIEARRRILAEGRSTDIFVLQGYGGERHFEARSALIAKNQILTVTREITDAVLNARDLRAGERLWRTLADTASEGILVLDADAVATFASKRVAEILGWPQRAIVGRSLAELLSPEDYRRINPYRRAVRRGERVSFELEMERDTPAHRWVLTSATPIMTDGVYTGSIALFTDTTALHSAEDERRALAERLRTVEATERQLLAHQLHDGPIQELVAVDLRLGVLRRSVDGAHQHALLGIEAIVESAVVQLRGMMSELLPPELQPGSVYESLAEHVDRVVPAEVKVAMADTTQAPPHGATANALFLIGREAITNAARHAGADHIEISLSDEDGGFRLTVTDDGSGMDVSAAPAKRGHLGVRAMYDRAEVAGGRVIIHSQTGGGTTVDAWVPTTEPGATNLHELPSTTV